MMIGVRVQKLLCRAAKLRRLRNMAKILKLVTYKRKLEAYNSYKKAKEHP